MNGTLQLDQPSTFSGSITGFAGNDSIVLAGIPSGAVTGYSYAGNASNGVLTINEGGTSVGCLYRQLHDGELRAGGR